MNLRMETSTPVILHRLQSINSAARPEFGVQVRVSTLWPIRE